MPSDIDPEEDIKLSPAPLKWKNNEEIQIFRHYLHIPTVQPDVDYSKNKKKAVIKHINPAIQLTKVAIKSAKITIYCVKSFINCAKTLQKICRNSKKRKKK